MKATLFILVSVLVMGWTGLHGQYNPGRRVRGRTGMATKDRFNLFDIDLLLVICNNPAETGSNVMVSPVSVKAVLAMLLEGASGLSAEQITRELRLGQSKEGIRKHVEVFLQSLQNNGAGYSVKITNRLFVANHLQVRQEYVNALRSYYQADTLPVNFSQQGATAKIINDWVNSETHGLIPTLVDPQSLATDSLMMFANALYFKGKWKESFDANTTTVRSFHTSANQHRDSYMMESLSDYRYANSDILDAQAIELPYDGDKFSMLVLVPNKVDGIQQLVRDLRYGIFRLDLEITEISVMMPRFSIEYNTELSGVLRQLGIEDVFGSRANLSGIVTETNSGAYVSKVIHKTKIEVNEEGTTAAGSTGALVVPLIGTSVPKVVADRPFLFFIRDLSSGGYLFAGRVNLPDPVISNPYPDVLTSKAPPTSGKTHDWGRQPEIDVRSSTGSSGGSVNIRMQGQTSYTNPSQNQFKSDGSYANVQAPQAYNKPQINPMPQQYNNYGTQPTNSMRTSNQQTPNQENVLFPNTGRK